MTVPGSWYPAYVALGSNLDDPEQQVRRASAALDDVPQSLVVLRSGLYRTPPFGPVAQPDFINAVAGLLTRLDPRTLLRHLKDLEQRMGRTQPVVRWGPRRIDLDLLMHGESRIEESDLHLPHPGIAQRAFVLVPLAQIGPELMIPGVGRVKSLLNAADARDVERIDA